MRETDAANVGFGWNVDIGGGMIWLEWTADLGDKYNDDR